MSDENEIIEGTAVAVRVESQAPAPWTPSFAVAVDEAIERKRQKARFLREVMEEGQHYGVIPGTGTKPTLLKPGAEMLLSNMGLAPSLSDAEPPIRDYDGTGDGHGEGLIIYRRVAKIYRQTGIHEDERMLVAQAEGSCSSREKKYRYRTAERKCPECGKAAIINGKPEYNNGIPNYVCFKKKGGCGANFAIDDPRIEVGGQVPNPDLADCDNTILKMADKRALVAATLLATGCSDIYTMDLEDRDDSDSWPTNAPGGSSTHQPDTTKTTKEPPKGSTASEPSPAQLRSAHASVNALLSDERLTPWEVAEAVASVLGPDADVSKCNDLPQLRELHKALNRKVKAATGEIPL